MNEIELKNRFITISKPNNLASSFLSQNFKPNNVIEIKNEGLNKKFDLILAFTKTEEIKTNEIKYPCA